MSRTTRTRRTALPFVVFAGAVALTTITACSNVAAPSAETTASADAQPTPLTCGGLGIEDSAQISYQNEILIDAPLSTVWNLHTDVGNWPTWQQPVTSVESLTPAPLGEGFQFLWTTPAPATAITPATTLNITSTVQNVEPDSCIRWSGPAIGDGLTIDNGVHVWNFQEVDGGTLVRTEESWTGAQVEADVPMSTTFLGAGLDAWLNDLEVTAESRPTN